MIKYFNFSWVNGRLLLKVGAVIASHCSSIEYHPITWVDIDHVLQVLPLFTSFPIQSLGSRIRQPYTQKMTDTLRLACSQPTKHSWSMCCRSAGWMSVLSVLLLLSVCRLDLKAYWPACSSALNCCDGDRAHFDSWLQTACAKGTHTHAHARTHTHTHTHIGWPTYSIISYIYVLYMHCICTGEALT